MNTAWRWSEIIFKVVSGSLTVRETGPILVRSLAIAHVQDPWGPSSLTGLRF